MINQVPLLPQARQPRALVKINDVVVRDITSVEYVENNFYTSDSFHVRLPLYNDKKNILTLDYWQSQPAIMVELFMGFPIDPDVYSTTGLHSFILGGINDLRVQPFGASAYVEFDGFDLSNKFANKKTTEKYPNLTASQIVTKLAKKEGLNPVVTETKTRVGYYYTQDYVQLQSNVTEWDLMVYLAQQEGFQIFVRGKNLYFQPQTTQSNNPYVFQAQTLLNGEFASFNGESMTVGRNLNYARDVIVKIISWNSKTGRVTAEARATPTKKTAIASIAQPIGDAQTYSYNIPGLTKEQANIKAQQLLEQISQHERVLQVALPGDNVLRKDSVISVKGLSPSVDQTYYPDVIRRQMSTSGGYHMSVRCKNHSPQSVVII